MALVLLLRLPFSWVLDTARDLRQVYLAWRRSARDYVRAYRRRQVRKSTPAC